ncbi:hypothetical protein [Burkholderia catarinensis]|uniref:hypothetical protein n=1 Tax=Burkholderia catarinensis TaxID=1108140 RepID=UPI0035578692
MPSWACPPGRTICSPAGACSFLSLKVMRDGVGYGRKEAGSSEYVEQAVGTQTILHRPFHFREIQRDALFPALLAKRHETVGCADVDITAVRGRPSRQMTGRFRRTGSRRRGTTTLDVTRP